MESKVKQKIHENDMKNEAMSRNIFWTRKQDEDETFDEFVMSLRTLSADCNFDKLKDSLIRDQIVLGIRNKQFKDRVLEENLDLSECINLYKSFEGEEQRKDKESLEVNAVSNAQRDCRPTKTTCNTTDGIREKIIIQGSLQGINTSLKCQTVTIGSYNYTPKEKVHISSKGIVIVAPSLKTESRHVALQIQLNEVVRISVYYGRKLRMIFLYTNSKCGAYIRRALEMSEESGLYYDPGSQREAYQKIILFPEKLSEEAKVVLQSLFGTLLSKLNLSEAKKITPATKITTMSASASIASGTKCSNPAETKSIVICPPDSGGIPFNTEANTCPAQDHGDDGSKEEILGTVQDVETSLRCRKIRIGSYQYIPIEKVHISTEGIKIVASSLKNESIDVELQIKLNEVVLISVHCGKGLPVIFLCTKCKYSAYIRKVLGMSEESGLSLDPESKHDPSKMIILFPTQISEEAEVVLRCLFGKLFNPLSSEEANEILVRAYGRKENAPIIKSTKRYISAFIESGTKCSTPVKIAPKPICSPDKVTPFKVAPKSICPPDKLTPCKIAPKPICPPDKLTPCKIAPKPICPPDKLTPCKIAPKPICPPDKLTPCKIAPKPICPLDKLTPCKIAPKPMCTPEKVGIPITTETYTRPGPAQDHGGDGSREDIIQGSLQDVTSLSCSIVRIGSYRFTPNEQVVVSSNGIKIVAPSLKNESDVTLQIQSKDVVKISVHYRKRFRIIFLDTQFECGAYIRNALGMSEESGLYYDPGSKHDPYQKIILSPEKISQEAKVALQSLFGELLTELTTREANEILVKTFCSKVNTPVTKMGSRSASALIAFETKCSTLAEIKRIKICPLDKSGLPIATEANTRLAQDHGGDRSGEIICMSVLGMVASLSCHTVRIGSYKYAPKKKVYISTDGIKIVAPSLKNGCRDVALLIQLKEVVRISVHYGKGLLLIFLDTLIRCGAYVREALEMSEESGLYFDPGSKHDPYKRIIFFPKEISEDAQVVLQSLFGELFEELPSSEAIRILAKTACKKNTTAYSSATIESGPKCSGKGGIPINTDTYTYPAQDHGDEEEKSQDTDDVNADDVNTDDVTTAYVMKTEEYFKDSASVGGEEMDEDIKSESTDVNAGDDVNTDEFNTVVKTEEFFVDGAETDEQSNFTLDIVKSESEDDVIISGVSGGQTTSQAWRSSNKLNSSCSFGFEEEKEDIKSENTDVNASDVRADDNTDEVTTGGGVVITEECFQDGADEGEEPESRPENPHQNNTLGVPMSSMESLPDKLLLNNNATACRLVDTRTRSLDAIDFSDSFWKTLCSKDFGNIEEDKKFSKLSYSDLYKSLSLWDKVEEAQVIEKELPLDPACAVGSFKLIGDKLLGVATIQTYLLKGETRYFDTLMYFDSDSLELLSKETYPFLFDQYDENDKLIVLFEQRIRLHVIIKSNKINFVYDIKKQYDYDVLSDNEIFFVNTNSVVCTARLKVVDGEETMETEKLTLAKLFPRSYIVAFARVNENVVNVLIDGGTKLLIYCCEHKNLNICGEIDHSTQCNVISKLREFGFSWCNPYVFRTLRCSTFTTNNQMYFTESVSPRNHVALVCTNEGSVNIFKRPYLDSGELYLSNIRPTTTIQIVNESLVMQQLDVVEILNGHRIFVRAGYNIFIFDLIHEQDRRVTKRRADTGTSSITTKKARNADEQ